MKILQYDAKANANLNILNVTYLARILTVLLSVEELLMIASTVRIFANFFHNNLVLQDCPCNMNCPNGCIGCLNPICVCGENLSPQNQDNLQECMKEKSIDLGQCIIDCNGNQSCEQSCVSLFKEQYEQCPCQV